jgi:hypothetical protein
MKKFTFKGVLDGIRSSVAPQIKPDQDIVETLRPDYFQVAKVRLTYGSSHRSINITYICNIGNIILITNDSINNNYVPTA